MYRRTSTRFRVRECQVKHKSRRPTYNINMCIWQFDDVDVSILPAEKTEQNML